MPDVLRVENHGPLILSTNYFDLPAAKAGKVLITINAGAFRLLIPPTAEANLADMRTAKVCVISRGPWRSARLPDGFEILFDDGTDSPFAFHASPESFDRLPAEADVGREFVLSAWTQPRLDDSPHKALERPCYYRRVASIPCLKPWNSGSPDHA